ncbi:hypothetical protein, partial [Rhizobium laguerreae]|uniref:hypothetical protein n=1 Tax=Rhizobium laguerreae TaxID=1076926 RepID=UPI001C91B080
GFGHRRSKGTVSAAMTACFAPILADLRLQINLPSITSTYRWLGSFSEFAAMAETKVDITSD